MPNSKKQVTRQTLQTRQTLIKILFASFNSSTYKQIPLSFAFSSTFKLETSSVNCCLFANWQTLFLESFKVLKILGRGQRPSARRF